MASSMTTFRGSFFMSNSVSASLNIAKSTLLIFSNGHSVAHERIRASDWANPSIAFLANPPNFLWGWKLKANNSRTASSRLRWRGSSARFKYPLFYWLPFAASRTDSVWKFLCTTMGACYEVTRGKPPLPASSLPLPSG